MGLISGCDVRFREAEPAFAGIVVGGGDMRIMQITKLLGTIGLLTVAMGSPASAIVMDFESLAFPGFSNQAPQGISATPTTY